MWRTRWESENGVRQRNARFRHGSIATGRQVRPISFRKKVLVYNNLIATVPAQRFCRESSSSPPLLPLVSAFKSLWFLFEAHRTSSEYRPITFKWAAVVHARQPSAWRARLRTFPVHRMESLVLDVVTWVTTDYTRSSKTQTFPPETVTLFCSAGKLLVTSLP